MREDVGGRGPGQAAGRTSAALRALACAALALCGCGEPSRSSTPPNVMVILVDTLRPDRLGSYGNARGLTPFLDELAADGFVFTKAHAASSWTRPSVASLLTSRYPSQHGVVTVLKAVAEEELTLAEVFQRLGYVTAAVSGSPIISAGSGFSQGFDHFEEFPWRDKVRTDRIRTRTLTWLDTIWAANRKPVFLYLHLMEPHGPYKPPEPYRTRFRSRSAPEHLDANVNRRLMRAWGFFMQKGQLEGFRSFGKMEVALMASLYDGEVASLDAELRLLFDELRRRGLLDDAIVVITADHGEEFYEHGGTWHGITLFNESIRVPLIVVPPGTGGGAEIDENASLVDVAPTLLEMLHAPVPPAFEGRSFAKSLERRSWVSRRWSDFWRAPGRDEALSELEQSGGHPNALPKHTRALVRDSLKVMTQPGGGSEAYDLARDPAETQPTPPDLAPGAAALLGALERRHAELAARSGPSAQSFELDAATRLRLRALGYAVDEEKEGGAGGN